MLLPYLHRVAARENLSAEDAREAMLVMLSGEATTPQIAAFLVGLRTKGETADELLGFARAMREKAARVDAGVDSEPLLDTCGTGGDGHRRSISRPSRRSLSRARACELPSTAIGRYPASAAAPMCWRSWVST